MQKKKHPDLGRAAVLWKRLNTLLMKESANGQTGLSSEEGSMNSDNHSLELC